MSDSSENPGGSTWQYPTERDPAWTVASGLRHVVATNPSGKPDAGFSFMHGDGKTLDHFTFGELLAEVQRRGRHLLAMGIEPGERVAIIVPEPDEFILTFLACLDTGIVAVPMYPPLSFGKLDAYIDGAANILSTAGAKLVVSTKRVQAVLWSLVDRVPNLDKVVTVESVFASGEPKADIGEYPTPSAEDIAFLQFTSGSTAAPKGVVVTNGNLGANIWAIMVDGLEIDPPNDVAVTWLPLYHDMGLIGLMLCPLTWGIPTVYIPTLDFVKHPTRWMQAIHDHRGTITFAPNFAYALSARRTRPKKLEGLDLSCLRVIGCGAEPNHPGTLRTFVEHFAPAGLAPTALYPVYGMAEATLAMAFSGLDDTVRVDRVQAEPYAENAEAVPVDGGLYHLEGESLAHTESPSDELQYVTCGRTFPEHEIKIIDDDGNPLPDRTVGEIVFSGPSVATGYWQDPENTARAFTEHGLRTGDLGYLVDGELFVTGRKKDIVILNGRNYDPQTIEWLATEIDGVRKGNVVAFSVPGERTEELVVVAEARDDIEIESTATAIKQLVQQELFLSVRDVVLTGKGTLPKTSSGKLQRAKTRKQYLDGVLGKEGVRTLGERGQTIVVAKHVARSAVSRVRASLKNGVRNGVRNGVSGIFSALRPGMPNAAPEREERVGAPTRE